jgi:hypothetical protein
VSVAADQLISAQRLHCENQGKRILVTAVQVSVSERSLTRMLFILPMPKWFGALVFKWLGV